MPIQVDECDLGEVSLGKFFEDAVGLLLDVRLAVGDTSVSALPAAIGGELSTDNDVDGHEEGMDEVGQVVQVGPVVDEGGSLRRFNHFLHILADHTHKVVEFSRHPHLLSCQLLPFLVKSSLFKHQLAPLQVYLHKLVLLSPLLHRLQVLLVLLPHLLQYPHQLLQSQPNPRIRVSVGQVLYLTTGIHYGESNVEVALILVLVLEAEEEASEEIVHSCNNFRAITRLTVLDADGNRFSLSDAVPDGLGEILAEDADGVFILSVRVDDVADMEQFGPFPFASLPRLAIDEGVEFLLEHVEQVDAVFEEESFCQLHVRIVVWVHCYSMDEI